MSISSLTEFYSDLCNENLATFYDDKFILQRDLIFVILQSFFDLLLIYFLAYIISIWIAFIISSINSILTSKCPIWVHFNHNYSNTCIKYIQQLLVLISYIASFALSVIVMYRIIYEYISFHSAVNKSNLKYNSNISEFSSINQYFCWISIELSQFLMYRNILNILIISGITLIDSILILFIAIFVCFSSCITSFLWFFYYCGILWFVRDNRDDYASDYNHKLRLECKSIKYCSYIFGIICCPACCTIATLLLTITIITLIFGIFAIIGWFLGFSIIFGVISLLLCLICWLLVYKSGNNNIEDVFYLFFLYMINPFVDENKSHPNKRGIHEQRFMIGVKRRKKIIEKINLHAAGSVEFAKTLELMVGQNGKENYNNDEMMLSNISSTRKPGLDDHDGNINRSSTSTAQLQLQDGTTQMGLVPPFGTKLKVNQASSESDALGMHPYTQGNASNTSNTSTASNAYESKDSNPNNDETAMYVATSVRKNTNDKMNFNYQVGIRSTYFHSKMLLDFLLPIIIVVSVFVTFISWHFFASVLQFYELGIQKLLLQNYTNVIGQAWDSMTKFYSFLFGMGSINTVWQLVSVDFDPFDFFGNFQNFRLNVLFCKCVVFIFVSVLQHFKL